MSEGRANRVPPTSVNENFDVWLTEVSNAYKKLTPIQQVESIVKLMRISCPEQKFILEREMARFLQQDILVALPRELQELICDFIDVESLFTACCVSKQWNLIVSSLNNVWRNKGVKLGIGLVDNGETDWKRECLRALRVLNGMHSGQVFQHNEFPATCLTLDHVTGLCYSDGLLVGTAEDLVGVWRTTDYELVAIFSVPYRISCLQMNHATLVLGHTNGCVTAWNVRTSGLQSPMNDNWCSADMFKELSGHTGVVMSVSASTKVDLLVSGSTDFTAKLWSIRSGTLIRTLSGHSHWVIQVSLFPHLGKTSPSEKDEHRLITKTRDSIHLFSWSKNSSSLVKSYSGDIASIENSMKVIPLNPVGNFITSGCHISGKNVVFIRQIWAQGSEGGAEITFHDVENLDCMRKVQVDMKIRKLLAVGKVFGLVLQPWSQHNKFNLTVINITNGQVVGGCYVPHSSSSTPDLAQITIGNVSWCDGLTFLYPDDIVVGLGLANGVIHVVTWKDLGITAS